MADRRGRTGHAYAQGATKGYGVSELRRTTAFSCRAASGTAGSLGGRPTRPQPDFAATATATGDARQPTLEDGVTEAGTGDPVLTTGALLGGIGVAVTSTLA